MTRLKKYDSGRYSLEYAVKELCSIILLISIGLAESEEGVNYFFKHARDMNKETTLYCALELVEDDLWIEVYKYGLANKINPRNSLKAMYNEKKAKKCPQIAE